jgi:hypothetical protein
MLLMTNEIKLAHSYYVYNITSMLEQDVKFIKKINTVLHKYERSMKEQYPLEVKNILITLQNSIDIKKAKFEILYYIEDDFKETVEQYIEEL